MDSDINSFFELLETCPLKCPDCQGHNHEFSCSTSTDFQGNEPHSHRFSGISSAPVPIAKNCHIHCIETITDYFDGHHHKICEKTGPAIQVSENRHTHFLQGMTNREDCHFHDFTFTVQIENPAGEYPAEDYDNND